MLTKIQLMEAKTDEGKELLSKYGVDTIAVVNIEGIIKMLKSEDGAKQFLKDLGYERGLPQKLLETGDVDSYIKVKHSKDENMIEKNFKIVIPKKKEAIDNG